MENLSAFVLDLTLILVTAGVVTILFKRINQPVVLGYIVAGFLISPNFIWLPTVIDVEDIHVWADIGIIFLMFALGLEFSFHKIAKVGGSAIITALVVMSAMILTGCGIGQLLGWSTMNSLFLGAMISMSSTMIILKAYDELNLKEKPFAQLTLGVLVIEDIAGIFMMIVLTALSVSKEVSGIALAGEIGILLLVLVVILCVGIYLVPTLLKIIERYLNDEILMIVSLGFCFLMVVISAQAGFSEALGAFLAGSILAGTSKGERIEEIVKPLKDLFGAVFFVSVGMLIEPSMLAKYIVPILLITVATVCGQMVFSTLGALASGQPFERAVRVGFSMVQVGEFSFIIASLGDSLGVTDEYLYPIIVCVSVITTFTTPVFIKCGEGAAKKLYLKMPNRLRAFLVNYTSDRQSETADDGDWVRYLKKYFVKLLIGAALLFGFYIFGTKLLYPYLSGTATDVRVARIASLAVTVIVMAPVVNLICTKRSLLYNKLWLKNKANIFPLLTLRAMAVGISAMFLVLTLRAFFAVPLILSIALALVVVAFSMKSDFVKGRSAQLQITFLANFNQKILNSAKTKRERENLQWVDDVLYVFRFRLTKIYRRKLIRDFVASRVFGVMFIDLIHPDGRQVPLPKADDKLEEGDILYAMGTKEQLEAYSLFIEKTDYAVIDDRRMETLKEYIEKQKENGIKPENMLFCAAIPVDGSGEFARRPISESGFIEKYEGIIAGVERDLFPIASPKSDFVLMENDILWALGAQNMLDALVRNGILEEN